VRVVADQVSETFSFFWAGAAAEGRGEGVLLSSLSLVSEPCCLEGSDVDASEDSLSVMVLRGFEADSDAVLDSVV